ncbi:MAG: energy-coupling factor transporter transmembrane component T, partial [Candidatus Hydrothermarchaeota archaeon]
GRASQGEFVNVARQGGLVTWRFVVLILASSLLTLTTAPTTLAKGIEGLLRPLRVRPLGISPKSWGFMLSLSMRFLPMVADEGDKVRKAQWARGLGATRRSPRAWVKGAVSLALPMLRGLFRRADEVAKAVEARGYRPG